jgi:hypothetical protein
MCVETYPQRTIRGFALTTEEALLSIGSATGRSDSATRFRNPNVAVHFRPSALSLLVGVLSDIASWPLTSELSYLI